MRVLAAAASALILSACAASGSGVLDALGGRSTGGAVTGLPLGEAPALRLSSGQCALALWTRTEPAVRIAIAVSQPAELHINLDGRDLTLVRTASDGEPVFGHTPNQTWSGDGVTVAMTATVAPRDGMVGGAVARDAMLVLTDRAGQELVIPAAGLVACQG